MTKASPGPHFTVDAAGTRVPAAFFMAARNKGRADDAGVQILSLRILAWGGDGEAVVNVAIDAG